MQGASCIDEPLTFINSFSMFLIFVFSIMGVCRIVMSSVMINSNLQAIVTPTVYNNVRHGKTVRGNKVAFSAYDNECWET